MNLIDYARRELELIGAFGEEKDFYGGMMGNAVMELVETFAKQRHSGMSANLVMSLFKRVAMWKPLSPLTLKDDEWNEVGPDEFQNKRNSAVFKIGRGGKPYYIDAYTMCWGSDPTNCWHGSLELTGNRFVRRCYIKDVSQMPTVKILIPTKKTGPNNCDWKFLPVKENALAELKKFYDLEIEKEAREDE